MTQEAQPAAQPQHAPYRRVIARALKDEQKLRNRIAEAIADGYLHKAKHLQGRYLVSRNAAIAAMVEANRRSPRQLRVKHRDMLPLVDRMNVRRDCGEPIRCYAERRGPGRSPRPIHSYGLVRRAQQVLVLRAMREFCNVDQRAFLQRGRDAAVQSLVEQFQANGWRWFAELDIQNFFPSINREQLARLLPVDRKIFDTVIVSEEAERRIDHSQLSTAGSSAIAFVQGLPQGAITSSLAADVVVTRLFQHLPRGFEAVNFGDNFYLGARTRRELIQKIRTLEERISLVSARQLALVNKQGLRRVDWGFDCLGYRIRSRLGRTIIEPTPSNKRKFAIKAIRLAGCINVRRASARFFSFFRCWRSAFPLWPGGEYYCSRLIELITASDLRTISVTGATSAHLRRTMRARFGLGPD